MDVLACWAHQPDLASMLLGLTPQAPSSTPDNCQGQVESCYLAGVIKEAHPWWVSMVELLAPDGLFVMLNISHEKPMFLSRLLNVMHLDNKSISLLPYRSSKSNAQHILVCVSVCVHMCIYGVGCQGVG